MFLSVLIEQDILQSYNLWGPLVSYSSPVSPPEDVRSLQGKEFGSYKW